MNPWPWRAWIALILFAVGNALGAFATGLTAALLSSDRLGNAAMVCGITAIVAGMGIGAILDGKAPQRGLPRPERVRLQAERARIRLEKEIKRLEKEVEL